MSEELKSAVVTGVHQYDVLNLYKLFREMEGVDAYIQNMFDFATDTGAGRESYDVVVFYNMHGDMSGEDMEAAKTRAAIEGLGETKQGIVLLHHAILAYRDNPIWNAVSGIEDRKFGYFLDETVEYTIENTEHPITKGVNDFQMVDETYAMDDAGEGSTILITTDHPKSMKTIAWTRAYKNARVFCYESGHDNTAYSNENFRRILRSGIFWAAGRI
jgi:type 1 glutamine amidotransferase